MDGRKGFEKAGWKVNEGYKQIVAVSPEGKEYFICQKGETLPSLKEQGKTFGDVITDSYNAAVKQGLIEVNDAESFEADMTVGDGFKLGLGGAMGFAAFGITLGIIGSLLKSKED